MAGEDLTSQNAMSKAAPGAAETLRVHHVRGHPVVLDTDLARLFGVETFRLNE